MRGEATLETVDEQVSLQEVRRLVREVYGLEVKPERLSGERDQNFRLRSPDGTLHLLKLSNSAEDPLVTDLQTQALLHIAQSDDRLPTPRLIRALDGCEQVSWSWRSGGIVTVRLLTYLQGEPLSYASPDGRLLEEIGAVLGRLHQALRGFKHIADSHELLWDVRHAGRVRQWLSAIEDSKQRELADRSLDRFERLALPRLQGLPEQLIHNDFNPHNILIDREGCRVSGILDLGDAVRAPRVVDVAVAAAYHVATKRDAIAGIAPILRGYHSQQGLLEIELEVLLPLITGRLAMTTVITAWRASRQPSNRDYILKNAPAAWAGLEKLAELDYGKAAASLRRLVGSLPA